MNEYPGNNDDRKLVEKCIKGNSLAQKELFQKYYALMMGICLRYAANRYEAKEILQDGYIKIFNSLPDFKFEGSLEGWLRRIMVNTAIDRYRKRISEPVTIEISENVQYREEYVMEKLDREDLLKAIQQLPFGYRTVFNMFVLEGFSHKDIAEKLGITEGTSKSQLAKAKETLKEILKKITE
jgi:RNA polymerase sigma factor (sigma-70 family)